MLQFFLSIKIHFLHFTRKDDLKKDVNSKIDHLLMKFFEKLVKICIHLDFWFPFFFVLKRKFKKSLILIKLMYLMIKSKILNDSLL